MPVLIRMPLHRQARGFTLIELLITLVLLGILFSVGLPAFRNMIGNAQVRTVAEGVQNGLRLAREEALRSNTPTVFALTTAAPAAGVGADATGRNWFVQTAPAAGTVPEYIQGGSFGDVANGVGIASAPAIACFNSNGRITQPAAGTVALPPGAVGCPAPGALVYDISKAGMSDRSLRVQVALGGQVRLCDPQRTLSATVPDGC